MQYASRLLVQQIATYSRNIAIEGSVFWRVERVVDSWVKFTESRKFVTFLRRKYVFNEDFLIFCVKNGCVAFIDLFQAWSVTAGP